MRTRHLLTSGLLALGSVLGAAPAVAQVAASEGSEAVVSAPTCTAVVTGEPGQQVVLDPRAVVEPVVDVLATLEPLLGPLVGPFEDSWMALGPIPVGTVPERQGEIPGSQIGSAVEDRLTEVPALGPVLGLVLPPVADTLTGLCGILVREAPPDPRPGEHTPPVSGVRPPPADQGGSRGGEWSVVPRPTGEPAGARGAVFGEQLSEVPFVPGAAFERNTGGVPYLPVNPPGAEGTGSREDAEGRATEVGSADSLAARQRSQLVTVPVLLAVLLLAIVAAQLIRRWTLGDRGKYSTGSR